MYFDLIEYKSVHFYLCGDEGYGTEVDCTLIYWLSGQHNLNKNTFMISH